MIKPMEQCSQNKYQNHVISIMDASCFCFVFVSVLVKSMYRDNNKFTYLPLLSFHKCIALSIQAIIPSKRISKKLY